MFFSFNFCLYRSVRLTSKDKMYPNTPKSKIVATNEILATPVTTRSASGMYALLLLLDVDALIAYIFYTVPKNACSQQILLILC